MSKSQQSQTLDYFKSHALDWQNAATNANYSVIENRHHAVLEAMKAFPKGSSLLDVGCGTGQLAIEASELGWNATGIDFAEEMIAQCNKNNTETGAKAKFECVSVFDYKPKSSSIDVISAQGFIEYISLEQLDAFLDFAYTALKPDGVLAMGSRNRLYNLHSLNAFTELESALGTTEKLLKESLVIQNSSTVEEALASLKSLDFQYEQPEKHPITGVKVETRFQFSPSDLICRLAKHRFKPAHLYPVHYHPLPLSLMGDQELKVLHTQLAKYASDSMITRHQLVPYCSSFVIAARK